MKKIALVVLYFGELPKYTKLFFESLKFNNTIDLLLFTDQKVEYDGDNLKVYVTTFKNIISRIQSKFDFKIVCDRPYKLCDYKVTYGYVFENELREYDYWGYCDLDMILGDMRQFLKDNLLDKYEKIYQYGHMTLFKNTKQNNTRFMKNIGMDYKRVFTTPVICVFDEVEGIQRKYDLMKIPTYKRRDCADIYPWSDHFKRVESYLTLKEKEEFNYIQQVFYWEEGHLNRAYVQNGKVIKDEFIYLHFQRRKMPFRNIDIQSNNFYITRDGIVKKIGTDLPTIEIINNLNGIRKRQELIKMLEHIKYIWKRRINKYILKK